MLKIKRVAIFAHFDINNIIEDYVVFYLKELKKYVNTIIFVSDSDIQKEELLKISSFVDEQIVGKHGEYDFGSYKKGYLYLQDNNLLNKYDELILVNDSCYAPIFDFKEMFDEMSNKNCDFWGNTYNFNTYFGYKRHIQSYFVVLKQAVFLSKIFDSFMKSIQKENSKKDIVKKYEYGLTDCLENAQYVSDVYCDYSKKHWSSYLLSYEYLITKNKTPFLKRSIALRKEYSFGISRKLKKFILQNTTYDYKNLIEKDIKNNKVSIRIYKFLSKYICRKFIFYSSYLFRLIVKFILLK